MIEDNKIFIGGLNYKTTEESLQTNFEVYGTIINVRIVRDPASGKSRGFGFITFANAEDANKALAKNNEKVDGRVVGVKLAFNKRQA